MHEQQEQPQTANATTTPHPPFFVDWTISVSYSGTIDPSLRQFAGFTPADFPVYDSGQLTGTAFAALEVLRTQDNMQSVGDREVVAVTSLDGTDLGNGG
ncbi:hypothetical protein [Nocardia sp. NRRL S-836]|uniref:hypothetical protein n=1 Tax=Nocardia sp. NRRL S-836 TaxID=1519492 RepID=UPI0006AF2637|nr:hypothetical protein [Nocardia sp. NRRL S-836]KOV77321.1 hypothetical protein ADL03_41810 [Nocardia sp. NRRL S-836]